MSARERSLFRVTWFNFRVLHSFPSNLPIFANTSPSSPSTNNGNAVKKTTPDQKKEWQRSKDIYQIKRQIDWKATNERKFIDLYWCKLQSCVFLWPYYSLKFFIIRQKCIFGQFFCVRVHFSDQDKSKNYNCRSETKK